MIRTDNIKQSHGSGGKMSQDLIEAVFLPFFKNSYLMQLDDSAVLKGWQGKIAFTTDSYVVDPLIFPGGDIGKLAVCGTVNDLAVQGAIPLYLTCGFILEEGLEIAVLKKIVQSMAETANQAGVKMVSGDTKVVAKGSGDKIYINTSGIGRIEKDLNWGSRQVRTGDDIIINGNIGEHGLAVLLAREDFGLESDIVSDVNPLSEMISMLITSGVKIHAMRDPTRGGLAATLNEIAAASQSDLVIEEESIPISEPVYSVCQLLGLDAFTIANEGKSIIFADSRDSKRVLEIIKSHPLGRNAAKIGTVHNGEGQVILKTRIGGKRLIDMPLGELLPRIC